MTDNRQQENLRLGVVCRKCRSMSRRLLSVDQFLVKYGEVMRGFDAGCPFCNIVHSAANRAIIRKELVHSSFLICKMTVSGSLDSEHLSTEIQRKEVGQQTDAGKPSNDFASMKISVPQVRRGMTLFYSPSEDARGWAKKEIGRIEMYAPKGMRTINSLAFQRTIDDSCLRRPCIFFSSY